MTATIAATALVIAGAGALALLAARILGALYANHLMRKALKSRVYHPNQPKGGNRVS